MNRVAAGAALLAVLVAGCGRAADRSDPTPVDTAVDASTPTAPSTSLPTTTSPAALSVTEPSTTAPPTTAPPTTGIATTVAPAPGTTTASAGCAAPAAPATTLSITSGGATRTSLLSLPTSLTVPAPLVIDLHGLGADAGQQAAYSRLAERGPAAGIAVAAPESSGGPFWVLPVAPGTRDVVFVRDLIAAVGTQYCIDTARVVVTGISNGGGLAAGVGCELADIVTAVVPVSGVNIAPTCAAPSSIVAFHGTADPIIPYDGGTPLAGGGRDAGRSSQGNRDLASMSLPSVESVMSLWASANGCTVSADTGVGTVTHRVWSGCRSGRVTELYIVAEGGHTWPGGAPVPALGATATDVDATQIVIDLATSLTRA